MVTRIIQRRLTQAGVFRPLLDLYDGTVGYDFGEVDERIRTFELDPAEKRGEVLLPITQGRNRNAYCILAHAFRTRGYEPVIPLCDADLPVCTYKGIRYDADDEAACVKCNHFGVSMLDEFGLEALPLAEILGTSYEVPALCGVNDPRDVFYEGIDVGRYALASCRQFFMKRSIDFDDPYERDVYYRFLQSAVKLTDVSHALLEKRPVKAVVGFHFAYIYGGIYLAVAEKLNVPAVSVSRGYLDQSLVFGNLRNRLAKPQCTDYSTVEQALDEPLTTAQERRIEALMSGRKDGSAIRFDRTRGASKTVEFEPSTIVVGLFTNLIWDASLEVEDSLFEDPYDWIERSIEDLGNRENTALFIKVHPAESFRGTNESVEQWINKRYDTLPENVLVIGSDTEVSPYALMEKMDTAIVYTSTVGIESAYEGIPVIVAGDTQYRGFGFTHDPATIAEYDSYLDELDNLEMTPEMRVRAQRYAYFLFVRSHIDFPFYESLPEGGVRHFDVDHDDITPGNEAFDLIVENAIADEPIVNPENRSSS